MAEASNGELTPEEIEAHWPEHQFNRIIALRELRHAEYEATHDSDEEKEIRKKNKIKVEALHKRLLKELETTTYGDLIARRENKTQVDTMQEELNRQRKEHNKNVPFDLMPKM